MAHPMITNGALLNDGSITITPSAQEIWLCDSIELMAVSFGCYHPFIH
jgi:hypothetical protein